MPKRKYKWWRDVRRALYRYPRAKGKPEEADMVAAVERALERVRGLESWKEITIIIDLVYFKKTHTIAGAAMLAHVSERTAYRLMLYAFRIVAEEMGLKPKLAEKKKKSNVQ